jgi:hypothetical protein
VALDERLRRELDRAAQPADPSGLYEHLIRRRERRQIARKVQRGLLAVAVIAGSIAGVYGLSRIFETGEGIPGADPSPFPITPRENGRIAFSFSAGSGMELRTVMADGSGEEVIPTPPGMPWLHAWSPDGTRIAVSIFPNGGGDRAIWVMNADGSDPVQVAAADNVSVPSWSPDGSTIAYSARLEGRTEIHLVSADGTNDRIVHAEGAEGTFAVFSAKFSPDGTELLFDRGTDSGFDIFVMNVDGRGVRALTSTGNDYDPHWSPDGTQIAFTRQEIVEVDGQSRATSDIFLMNADGTDVRRLTDGGSNATNLYAEWSPDGTKIAYLAGITGGPGSLVVMNADGSDPTVLAEGDVLGISWQPLPATIVPQPSPGETVVPEPTPTESPSAETGEDIGLGFPVCNVTRVSGVFAPGVDGAAFVATKMGDTGGCSRSGVGFQVVAIDVSGDGLADASYGPLECETWCSAFAAPDVDGDGTDELLIQNIEFSIVGLRLYEVRSDPRPEVFPVTVAPPGDAPFGFQGFEGGEEPQFWIGGDAFIGDAIRCEPRETGRVLISMTGESRPHDSPNAKWFATETTFVLEGDELRVLDVRETIDDPLAFVTTGCGANLDLFS